MSTSALPSPAYQRKLSHLGLLLKEMTKSLVESLHVVMQPVHGGLTWPGRPQPKWPTQDDWLTLLPKPLRNPVKEFLRKRAMEDM